MDKVSVPFINDQGVVPYADALNLQRSIHESVIQDPAKEQIILVQHPPTITLGNRGGRYHILDEARLASLGAQVFETERGGEVTAHMPGQLVVYPILHLGSRGLSVRKYVCLLEGAVIEVLGQFGIQAQRHETYPGVWVGEQKICALGVRVSKRVSMHGIALNVSNDLDLFDTIVPCGIKNRGVCRMADHTAKIPEVADVGRRWVQAFLDALS